MVCVFFPLQCSDLQELCRYSQNVSPSRLIGLLCVLSTLTYWGFHFLACCVSKSSTGGSGIICSLPSQSLSDGEVLFLSLWPNNSNWCQSGGEKKVGGIKIPSFAVLRNPAALRCLFSTLHTRSCRVQRYREVSQNLFFLAHTFPFTEW